MPCSRRQTRQSAPGEPPQAARRPPGSGRAAEAAPAIRDRINRERAERDWDANHRRLEELQAERVTGIEFGGAWVHCRDDCNHAQADRWSLTECLSGRSRGGRSEPSAPDTAVIAPSAPSPTTLAPVMVPSVPRWRCASRRERRERRKRRSERHQGGRQKEVIRRSSEKVITGGHQGDI